MSMTLSLAFSSTTVFGHYLGGHFVFSSNCDIQVSQIERMKDGKFVVIPKHPRFAAPETNSSSTAPENHQTKDVFQQLQGFSRDDVCLQGKQIDIREGKRDILHQHTCFPRAVHLLTSRPAVVSQASSAICHHPRHLASPNDGKEAVLSTMSESLRMAPGSWNLWGHDDVNETSTQINAINNSNV